MGWMTGINRRVKKLGGKVVNESSGRFRVYQCEAPTGKVWACSSTHVLRVEWREGEAGYRSEAVIDGMERVGQGLADCDNPECDYCHPA